ncbi:MULTISPECIES: potassium-transporting ATPase subunit KdpA [Arthrobacter]|uniref:Potassium-transporting ATPase potassium-binding subunit n=2 Tax=Arthrobacter TaxID=1663 RepID=A0ABU9KKR9_9MICC|nr:potassium-transporting ATPase subunit KdpA [Arthrobacter sp. YJM1]MDP5227499.1 potassium-transporting ATPase subunit KdpA [Arthrobacter sp. YJM1]
MKYSWWSYGTQMAILLVLLGVAHRPLGMYLHWVVEGAVLEGKAGEGTRQNRVERVLFRMAGVSPEREQNWLGYARGVLAFSILSVLVVFLAMRLQALFSTEGLGAVDPWTAMNTAISFVTNTNWQVYTPETTVGIAVQMVLLAVQNFLSAAVGICVAVAFMRGLTRAGTDRLGNFWKDLVRISLRFLLPLAAVSAVLLIVAGVVQNFWATPVHNPYTGAAQVVPGGPVASQEAIKLLGTNGGGYFNANSAHPLENPNSFTNLFEVFLLLVIPSVLPWVFGRMARDARQGYTVLGVMGSLWLLTSTAMAWALAAYPGLGEGMEQRLGPAASGVFATATTLTSTGAVNAAHDSLPPLAGGVALFDMMLGEVAPGGVGSGLYGILVLAIVTVFLAGLMVGRTPEYLGKKVQAKHMTLTALYLLVVPIVVLVLTGIAVMIPGVLSQASAQGPHQFSEMLYAFTSAANNNGSAFGGITSSGPALSTMLGIAMWLGRFVGIVLILALAGAFVTQAVVPKSAGTLPTHGGLFAIMFGTVTVLLTALNYLPALALGPLAEGILK